MHELYFKEGIGDFKLRTSIHLYTTRYNLAFFPNDIEGADWDTYSLEGGLINLYTDVKGIIRSISCEMDCCLSGTLLTGKDLDLVFAWMGIVQGEAVKETIYFMDDTEQDAYDIDRLGLQVWVRDGKVITIFVSDMEE